MLGVGIWVTTQDTEYKHLAGNLVSLICYFLSEGREILGETVLHQNTIICGGRLVKPVHRTRGGANQIDSI